MGRLIGWAATAVGVLVVLFVAAAAGVVTAVSGNGYGTGCGAAVATVGTAPGGLSAEQAANAAVIVAVGQRMRVPVRGWVVAVATALQESELVNVRGGPDDSLGLFQQRPSQGWGTPEQLMSPDYAATAFYTRLLAVPGWERLPLTVAAQRVQRSAYPNAYRRHESHSTQIVAAYTGGSLPVCDGVTVAASGWTRPVAAEIGSKFRTGERPGHDGVDLMAPRGTLIRAASAGLVVRVRCNVDNDSWEPTGAAMPCDRDGSPGVRGCGWYVDIRHTGDIVTRYCHMIRQPAVHIGQTVTVGQPIGNVGSSGNSSAPHLHFEVHRSYPANKDNAVDPISFMADRGAHL
ncbi:hypothetical protein Val02_66450 [Virgisporangium aliadipatigenens]|uniref:M23ase beta-sheet core domain-containing protein n=1 Tax=Virgisporangium aliadipatigenens TaxID=741659 RepID=A0A8J3YQ55_9ACTN|nr:M23 family metallopeptidase [Virgisporangium aliadipatigenens]GIJ49759.1 hypothetical protein Val02_66450 [Virgisporangium aliadipatigenens]